MSVNLGSCSYRRRSGWTCDDSLLKLWGLDEVREPIGVIDRLVLQEDRVDPVTGAVLHLPCSCNFTIGPDGLLLEAIASNVNITEIMQARAEADRVLAESRAQRTPLQRVSELLASTSHELEVDIQNTAELAAGALGDGCVLRVLSADQRRIQVFAVAHRNQRERRALATLVAAQPALLGDGAPWFREVSRTGELCVREGHRPEPGDPTYPVGDPRIGVHYIVAPIRYDGRVLGFMSLYRQASEPPYDAADAALVQVLADRVGATIDASRAREMAERERVGRRASDDRVLALTSDQRELVLQLDSTESREQALLAEAVHDEPLQLVVAAMFRLDNLRAELPEQAGEKLDNIAQMLELSVEQLRKLIVVLTPPDLRSGLSVALERLAETVFMGSDTAVQVIGPSHVDLDPNAKTTVYRIVREALVNARKHARATHVTLEVRHEGDTVGLRLTDDGIGIAHVDAGPGHLGLASMRARAAAAHARLVIESTPGRGTVVDLSLPARPFAT